MAKLTGNINVSSVTAPYNFVPFEKDILGIESEKMPVRGDLSDELLSGEIMYRITAETPIFVDDGKKNFYTNERGIKSIPGTTIRGMVRANAQVLGVASYSDDLEDYYLMYRNVANGAEKDNYNKKLGNKAITIDGSKLSVLQNVEAGYISCEGEKYYIHKTKQGALQKDLGKMNYYILSERHISEKLDTPEYNFFKDHPEYSGNVLEAGFKKEIIKGRIHYKNRSSKSNDKYKPFYVEVSYEVSKKNSRLVSAVGEIGQYSKKGFLLGSGFMNEKKALYIIPEIDTNPNNRININDIDKDAVVAFKRDYQARYNTIKKNEKFFNLPESGMTKPVFFIELDGHFYFGFTPRLRLIYDNSISKGYKQKEIEFDFVKSIFGCTDSAKKIAYKSKVSFSDAVIEKEDTRIKSAKTILGEPKPTSYLDYICQTSGSEPNTYNTNDFELRGVKRYWLHNNIVASSLGDNASVASDINALDKGVSFCGKIRFSNLTIEELGLLCWSIRLEDNSEVNIGKAKSYGYGRCKISDITLKVMDYSSAYSVDGGLNLSPYTLNVSVKDYIDAYKGYASKRLGKNIDTLQSIKDLFVMSDGSRIPNNALINYMPLNGYQSRVRDLIPLPRPEDVVGSNQRDNNNADINVSRVSRNQTITVTVRACYVDRNDANKYVVEFDSKYGKGKAFDCTKKCAKGNEIKVKINNPEKIFGNYVESN